MGVCAIMREKTPRENITKWQRKKTMPNNTTKTKVRSIRASFEFWELVKNASQKKNMDINKFIVNIVSDYCKEVENGRK